MPSKLTILCLGVIVLGSLGCKAADVDRNAYDNDMSQLKDYLFAVERDNPEPTCPIGIKHPAANVVNFNEDENSIEIQSDLLFSSGSTSISSKGQKILHGLAIRLKGKKLTIVGHTDHRPIAGLLGRRGLYSDTHLEISVKRANAVMGEFLKSGILEANMFIVGRGATMPKGGHYSRNRRVEIYIEG